MLGKTSNFVNFLSQKYIFILNLKKICQSLKNTILNHLHQSAINVMPGSIVSWTNEDMTPHTVTTDNNLDSGPISPGDAFENVFDTPEELGYHCSIHPWMTGRVMVG